MDLTTRAGRREQGGRIQRAAEESGLSLEELAREIGCSRALLYQYVSGGVLAQSNRLQKIAQRTGHTLTYFFEDTAPISGDESRTDAETGAGPGAASSGDTGREAGPPAGPSAAGPSAAGRLTAERGQPGGEAPGEARGEARDEARGEEHLQTDSTLESPGNGEIGALWDDRRAGAAEENPPRRPQAEPSSPGGLSAEVARVALLHLEELADVQEAYGDSQGLLSSCERIVPYARQLGDREGEARAWLRIGNARVQRGHHDLALAALRVALSHFGDLGNTALVLACRQSLGRALLSTGDTDGALAEFQRVAAGDSWNNRWQGAVSIAALYEHEGNFREALLRCEEAAEIISAAVGVPSRVVDAARSYAVSNQANVYLAMGDFNNASRLSSELVVTAERCSEREQFIEGLINLGICQIYQGEWDHAEDHLSRAIDLARFSGDQPRWGFARAWMASLFSLLGDVERAKDEGKDALTSGMETSSRRAEIQGHLSLGDTYLKAAAPREALYHFSQALRAATSSSTAAQRILALQRQSAARLALGDRDQALSDLNQSLEEAQLRGIEHVEAAAREQLARMKAAEGDREAALRLATAARETAARLGLSMVHWKASALLASLLDDLSQDEAIERGAEAISILMRLRSRVLAHREEEALLDDPEALEVFTRQASRLLNAGHDPAPLVEEAGWPPFTAIAANLSNQAGAEKS